MVDAFEMVEDYFEVLLESRELRDFLERLCHNLLEIFERVFAGLLGERLLQSGRVGFEEFSEVFFFKKQNIFIFSISKGIAKIFKKR